MPYIAPTRDQYDIEHIYKLVKIQGQSYHNQARALRREQRRYQFGDGVYHHLLKGIRTKVFTNLHAGLREEFSANKTRKWFKHLCKLTVNERSHSWEPGDMLPVRYIIGNVEGLWDIINE